MDKILIQRASDIISSLRLDEKRKKISDIEKESSEPLFWQDHGTATKKMKQMANLQNQIKTGENLQQLIEKGNKKELEENVDKLEFNLYLSGTYDNENAIMSLHAGQGGTEAMDWTAMLYRMYQRYIDIKGWSYEEIDITYGEEAGIKSVTIHVSGALSYGMLKAEAGVHRLVRQSPFNADKLRQTSFSMVEVLPEIVDNEEVEINDEDLKWDFFRSSGKGGQNVNKVSTAVRLVHNPTGIVVESQTQRQQGQNRDYALKILRAKLWAKKQEELEKEKKAMKGDYVTPGWGNQIRSYVLHPYHMVKDLRTEIKTTHTDKVLDGDIESFIMAYLKKLA